jgi:transcriptional regulator with XRE-family HTH domain
MEATEISLARELLADGTARRVRKNARLSLRDAGKAVGVPASTVSRWERGLRTPRSAAAARYADLLSRLCADS